MELINNNLVCVVEYRPTFNTPRYGEYNHPSVISTTPCTKRDGKFIDLRTGQEYVPMHKHMVTWNICSGTVLQYPDGKNILISRQLFGQRSLMMIPISGKRINPKTMVLRKLVRREVKTN